MGHKKNYLHSKRTKKKYLQYVCQLFYFLVVVFGVTGLAGVLLTGLTGGLVPLVPEPVVVELHVTILVTVRILAVKKLGTVFVDKAFK